MNKNDIKIGLFGIGLENYWPQFPGLKERLESYLLAVQHKIERIQGAVVSAGLVDNVDKSFATGKLFNAEDVDVVFLYVTIYALSSTVLPVVQRAKVPVIILNLSPEASID